MKKSLFLLPLLAAFTLCGCGDDPDNPDKPSGDDFPGLTLDVETLQEESGDGKGYAALGDTEIDGVPVSFDLVMVNGLNSQSLPKWDTPDDEEVNVIQFAKVGGDKNYEGGSITVTGKISKLTLKVYSSYDWSGTGLPKVTFNDKTVKKPSKASETEPTGYKSWNSAGTKSFDLNLMTVEYAVNASEEGDLVIHNANSFALYFDSFILE